MSHLMNAFDLTGGASALVLCALALFSAACGELQEVPAAPSEPTAVPQWRIHLQEINQRLAATGYPTVNPDMSDAEYRQRLNEAYARNGIPTLDPNLTDAELTATSESVGKTVEADETPFPTTTPRPPSCGPQGGANGGESLIAQHGGVVTDCLLIGRKQIITTAGTAASPGVIAILECPEDDDPCLRGDEPSSYLEWHVIPVPAPAGIPVRITGSNGTPGIRLADALTINNGCGFSLASYELRCPGSWRDFTTPTPAVGPATPILIPAATPPSS